MKWEQWSHQEFYLYSCQKRDHFCISYTFQDKILCNNKNRSPTSRIELWVFQRGGIRKCIFHMLKYQFLRGRRHLICYSFIHMYNIYKKYRNSSHSNKVKSYQSTDFINLSITRASFPFTLICANSLTSHTIIRHWWKVKWDMT